MLPLDKEIIKKKISELATIRDILFYLDVSEKEVKDRISELYWKTRMNDLGDFLPGENGWEYVFEYREFNPEIMGYPPLNKDEQKQYLKDYGNEIKEAEDLYTLDYFIKDQKNFYEKQLVKYTLMNDDKDRIDNTDKKSDIKNISFREPEKVFQECLDRGTKYYLEHKHTRLNFIYFFMEMKKYFGEDIKLLKKVYYKIVNDNPIIKIFGYDYDTYNKKTESCRNKTELNTLFENEKKEIEKLLEDIHNYKPDYLLKWEKVNNGNVYEEDLEENGYVDNNDSDIEKHNKAWVKYFIENVENEKLREMLIYGFSGQMDESEDIDNNKSVKLFLDHIESELKNYKDQIVQNYLIMDTKLKENEEKKNIQLDDRDNITAVSNELSNAQGIILHQRNRIKSLEKGITKRELEKIIDDNKCRKKNGKLNYSAIGRILGCTHHTAKAKCKFFNIS